MTRKIDVAIVGAGIAGLTAARTLRDWNTVVLEREPFVGGRTRSVSTEDGSWFCLGAQYLPPLTQKIAEEVGVTILRGKMPPPALLYHGKRVIERNPVLWFFKVPFSLGGRISFLRLLAKISLMTNRYDRMSEADVKHLKETSLADWLGNVHPDMHELLEMWATFAGGKTIKGVSAYTGLAVVHAALGRPSRHYGAGLVTTALGGIGRIAQKIVEQLPEETVFTDTSVRQLRQTSNGVEVEYVRGGESHVLKAKYAIVTTPSALLPELISDLPKAVRGAALAIPWSRSITLGIKTNERDPMPWDKMYWLRVGGPWISNVLNPAYFMVRKKQKLGSALTILCSGEPADRLWELTDEEAKHRVTQQLREIFPEIQDHIVETVLQRWPFAYPGTGPSTVHAQSLLSSPLGRIYFAGDYLIRIGTQEAIETAGHAAKAVERRLNDENE